MFKYVDSFSGFSVNDLEKARQFYGEVLGIKITESPEGLTLHVSEGHDVFVYPKPNHEPSTYTTLNFVVEDIDETVDQLVEAGVRFEIYDSEYMKTDEKGIARAGEGKGPTIAWFKDPAGNFISIIEK